MSSKSGKEINRMRMIVSDAYPGMKWKARVAKMPTNQIVAIYKSIMARDCLNRMYLNKDYYNPIEKDYHQYNLFEFGLEMVK